MQECEFMFKQYNNKFSPASLLYALLLTAYEIREKVMFSLVLTKAPPPSLFLYRGLLEGSSYLALTRVGWAYFPKFFPKSFLTGPSWRPPSHDLPSTPVGRPTQLKTFPPLCYVPDR